MSSDTPRTDAEAFHCGPSPDEGFEAVPADACRKLERELAAALQERDQLRKEVSITRQIQRDLSVAFKTGNPSATELHYAQYAIADLRERAIRAEDERDQLRAWKSEALAVEREWDPQALAKLLGGKLGESTRKIIAVKVPQICASNDALLKTIKRLEDTLYDNCDHDWETEDHSFDHEFGTERVFVTICNHCGLTERT